MGKDNRLLSLAIMMIISIWTHTVVCNDLCPFNVVMKECKVCDKLPKLIFNLCQKDFVFWDYMRK